MADALKAAAQFHAYFWFRDQNDHATHREALAFSGDNWTGFLPQATEALGELLLFCSGVPIHAAAEPVQEPHPLHGPHGAGRPVP